MFYKRIIPVVMLCLSTLASFSMDGSIIDLSVSQKNQVMLSSNDNPKNQITIIPQPTPLVMDYSPQSKPRTWKYKLGEISACSYENCCYWNPTYAGISLTPGCITGTFSLGIPGFLKCFGVVIPKAVWIAGGAITGCCTFMVPAWHLANVTTIYCAECCNSSGSCTEFLEPVHQLKSEKSSRGKYPILQC